MKIKVSNYRDWNNLQKEKDTNSLAEPIDLVTMIDGVAFLIQRKNNFNNVICQRVNPSKRAIIRTFNDFRIYCHKKHLRYIRIEGGHNHKSHTYNILWLLLKAAPKTCGVALAEEESKELGSNVFYVKTY